MVKVRTLVKGLGEMNRPIGEIIEVTEEQAKYMIEKKQAEMVEEKKEEAKKKTASKK